VWTGTALALPRCACQKLPIACSPRPQHDSARRSVSRSTIEISALVSWATFRRFASVWSWLIWSLIVFNCVFGRVRGSGKKRPRTSSCPSVRMCQLGSYWTNFREVWYRSRLWKSFEKIHKVRLITGCAGPEMGYWYRSTLSLTSVLDGGGWLTPRLMCFTPGKDPVPIVQGMGAENLTPLGFDLRTVQPVVSRYTDCAFPAHLEKNIGYVIWRPKYVSVIDSDICRFSVQRALIRCTRTRHSITLYVQYVTCFYISFLHPKITLRVPQVVRDWRHWSSGKHLSPLTKRNLLPHLSVVCDARPPDHQNVFYLLTSWT